jgi:hypothetical protein
MSKIARSVELTEEQWAFLDRIGFNFERYVQYLYGNAMEAQRKRRERAEMQQILARNAGFEWKDATGFVYFVLAPSANRIKIGFTADNPEKRLKQLQTGSSERLDLIGFFPGNCEDETDLHRRFGHLRIVREWFV